MNTRRRKIRLSLAFIITVTIVIIAAILFRNWLLYGYEVSENAFLNTFKETYQLYLSYLQGDSPRQNTIIYYSMPFILFFITISLLSIVILFLLLIVRRAQKLKQAIVLKHQKNKVQNLIIEYLYSEDKSLIDKLKKSKKNLLVDQIITIHKSFIGNKSKAAKKLFYQLKLDVFTSKKISSFLWDEKVKYLHVAAVMNVITVIDKVKKNINSNNSNVRDAAQLALLELDFTHSFDWLHTIRKPISKWQQFNLHHLMVRESIPAPNFSKFILSQNKSVVIFSLCMMEAFAQDNARDKLLRLLTHRNNSIRHQVLHTIKDLGIKDATPILIDCYKKQRTHIKLDIIDVLANINTEESLAFLSSLLPNKKFFINMAILKSLNKTSRSKVLEKVTVTPDIDQILKHIANK